MRSIVRNLALERCREAGIRPGEGPATSLPRGIAKFTYGRAIGGAHWYACVPNLHPLAGFRDCTRDRRPWAPLHRKGAYALGPQFTFELGGASDLGGKT
jgi:hypothetical protein